MDASQSFQAEVRNMIKSALAMYAARSGIACVIRDQVWARMLHLPNWPEEGSYVLLYESPV